MATLDLVVLVSGAGSNLQAILDAVSARTLDARVRLVVSNKPDAKALERAVAAGVPTRVLPHGGHATRADYDAALVGVIREALGGSAHGWIVLAGFMRLLTPTFLDAFPHRVLNVHPSLLPSFPGVEAQRQALAYGVRIAGCTVHLVDAGTDTGRILAQAAVPVFDGDDARTLGVRILRREHELLPAVLGWLASGALTIEHGTPRFAGVVPAFGLAPQTPEPREPQGRGG
ncbi:MAG: phosphoribosylglycinamide formyltransferase [Polyangiales bacterium]